MAEDSTKKEATAVSKKHQFRRDKPWDTPDIDKWTIQKFEPADNPSGLLEETSFAVLFPQYREKYLKQIWSDVKRALNEFHIKAELDRVEGSMTVRTTRKTWDPYIIIKARDMLRLLARSVPFADAVKILEDGTFCDVIKISGFVRNKERYIRRRQRLVGPSGSTLKAIELLTGCFMLVQGQTVSLIGPPKGLKQARRIVEDCMKNVHPVYALKELMIKRELAKDEKLKDENWDRFLPHFRKRNMQRAKIKIKKKSSEKSLFPPQPTPRKEDILMESGEYFLSEELKKQRRKEAKEREAAHAKAEKKREREAQYIPPPPQKKRKGH